ncbi:3-hydroxyacyl-CoA dehydrogenase family protein [uncultured Tateyamaria sp.]|uniref:3-hydroxyacyl-CoA dehydrogenase family protein n=1 Tax=uncultured Tateyamaria sp. TaxID=455651 RepID=UPI00261FE075|nr:3-hydroxyacyl-CoA dehydrogenase family protein [uncultured Tateyamaria sp.]
MTLAVAPLQDLFWRVCERLVYLHSTPWELDEALVAWGYGLGPFEAQDLVGLDTVLTARRADQVSPVLARMVAEGRLGKRYGWGYYRYPGGGGAVIDPLIEDLISEEAWFAKVTRTEVRADTLVARLHDEMGAHLRADPSAAMALLHVPKERLALI